MSTPRRIDCFACRVEIGALPAITRTVSITRPISASGSQTSLTSPQRRWGLVNEVCEPEALMGRVMETVRVIAGNAPISTRQAKQSIRRGVDMSIADGLAFEIEAYNRMVPTSDRREGVNAFNEKRKPDFKGK